MGSFLFLTMIYLLHRDPNATTNPELYQCCSGFCIDLLTMLSEHIGFEFDLFQVEDGIWGAPDPVCL